MIADFSSETKETGRERIISSNCWEEIGQSTIICLNTFSQGRECNIDISRKRLRNLTTNRPSLKKLLKDVSGEE